MWIICCKYPFKFSTIDVFCNSSDFLLFQRFSSIIDILQNFYEKLSNRHFLLLVGPNYVNGRIDGNKVICEAQGNPKPKMFLIQSDGELFSFFCVNYVLHTVQIVPYNPRGIFKQIWLQCIFCVLSRIYFYLLKCKFLVFSQNFDF